jgi:hypothetical protein
MSDPIDETLPGWVRDALRQDVTAATDARERIMRRVRQGPAPRTLSLWMAPPRWARRGLLSPLGLLVAVVCGVTLLTARRWPLLGAPALLPPLVRVLGDSVIPVANGANGDNLLDTMCVVDVVMRGTSIRSARLIVDPRRTDGLVMAQRVDGDWHVRVLTPPDALPLAVMVNDAQLVPIELSARRSDSL